MTAASEDRIVRMLRRRKTRRNIARMALAEYAATERKPGRGSLAGTIVVSAQMHGSRNYRRSVRRANRRDLLIRLHLRHRHPGRSIEDILADVHPPRQERK